MTDNDQTVQNPDGQPVTSASDQVDNVNEATTQEAPSEQSAQDAAPVENVPAPSEQQNSESESSTGENQ